MMVKKEVLKKDIPAEKAETGMDKAYESTYCSENSRSASVSVPKRECRNTFNSGAVGRMGPQPEGKSRVTGLV